MRCTGVGGTLWYKSMLLRMSIGSRSGRRSRCRRQRSRPQQQPVAGVGCGGSHDLGAGGHGLRVVATTRRQSGSARSAPGFAQASRTASTRCVDLPASAIRASPGPGQVFGGQLADEAGRPVQHDVNSRGVAVTGLTLLRGASRHKAPKSIGFGGLYSRRGGRRPARRGYPANAARSQPPGSAPPVALARRTPSHRSDR